MKRFFRLWLQKKWYGVSRSYQACFKPSLSRWKLNSQTLSGKSIKFIYTYYICLMKSDVFRVSQLVKLSRNSEMKTERNSALRSSDWGWKHSSWVPRILLWPTRHFLALAQPLLVHMWPILSVHLSYNISSRMQVLNHTFRQLMFNWCMFKSLDYRFYILYKEYE